MARDKFHYNARRALEKDGWTVVFDHINDTIIQWIKW